MGLAINHPQDQVYHASRQRQSLNVYRDGQRAGSMNQNVVS